MSIYIKHIWYVTHDQPLKTLFTAPIMATAAVMERFPSWSKFRELRNFYKSFIVCDMQITF